MDDSIVHIPKYSYTDEEDTSNFLTNKIILKPRINIKDFELWDDFPYCLDVIKINGKLLKYVKLNTFTNNQQIEMCLAAIQQETESIKYVPNDLKTFEMCKIASLTEVDHWKNSFQYIGEDFQTKELCEMALINNFDNLQYVRNDLRSFELCKLAVENDGKLLAQQIAYCKNAWDPHDYEYPKENDFGYALDYVIFDNFSHSQVNALCEIAVTHNSNSLKYVTRVFQTDKICKIALKKNGLALRYASANNKTFENFKLAVEQSGLALEYIDEIVQTEELCEIAVSQNAMAMNFVPSSFQTKKLFELSCKKNSRQFEGSILKFICENNKTFEICEMAIKYDPHALEFIKKPSENTLLTLQKIYDLCVIAISESAESLQFVTFADFTNNQVTQLCELAMENCISAIKYIDSAHQTNKMCEDAVKKYGTSIEYICKENKTQKICELAVENDIDALFHIEEEFQTIKMCKSVAERYKMRYGRPIVLQSIKVQTSEICELMIKSWPSSLRYVKKEFQTEKLCKLALDDRNVSLTYIDNDVITAKICRYAIKKKPSRFYDVPENLKTDKMRKLYESNTSDPLDLSA